MSPGHVRKRTTEWLVARNPSGLIYGAIITGAVLSAVGGHLSPPRRVALACVFVLGIYWLADVYVGAFAQQFVGERQPLSRRLLRSARHELSVLQGGIPAVVTFEVASVLGAEPSTATNISLWVTVVELAAFAHLAATHVGVTGRERNLETAVAALLGLVLVVAKTLLH